MKLRYIIPLYLHPSAPLGFLQLTILVDENLAHKPIGKSVFISYVLEIYSFTLVLDYTFRAA